MRAMRAMSAWAWLSCIALASTVCAQDARVELTAGTSALLVLGPVSGQTSVALDVSASGPFALAVPAARWSSGVRLDFAGPSPEVFARIALAPRIRAWQPSGGVEIGVSARGDDDSGDLLLREARASSRDGLSPLYLALHTAPLRFQLSRRLVLSLLELQLGAYAKPLGRYTRLHVGVVSLGFLL